VKAVRIFVIIAAALGCTTAVSHGQIWKDVLRRAGQALEENQRKRQEQQQQRDRGSEQLPPSQAQQTTQSSAKTRRPEFSIPDQQPMITSEFRAEAKVTFANGVELELARVSIAYARGLTYPPGKEAAGLAGSYSDVPSFLESARFLPVEQEGVWSMVDGRQIASISTELRPNARSPQRAPDGARVFGGIPLSVWSSKQSTAYHYLGSEDPTELVLHVKLKDGSTLRGRSSLDLLGARPSIMGISRVLGEETQTQAPIDRQLKDLTCDGGSCTAVFFTKWEPGPAINSSYREEVRSGAKSIAFEAPRLAHGCCAGDNELKYARFGYDELSFETPAGTINIADHRIARMEFTADARQDVTRTVSRDTVQESVSFKEVPTRLVLHSGDAAVVGGNNALSVRGWTRNGKLVYTALVGIAGQRIVHAIEFYTRKGN
jgi:hypothetical protein